MRSVAHSGTTPKPSLAPNMLITCPSCSHRFDAESVVVRRGYFPVRCSKCQERFEVNFRTGQTREASGVAPAPAPTPASTPTPAPVATEEVAADAATEAPEPGMRSKAVEKFMTQIRDQYDQLLRMDPFELLGVEVESSNQEVMQAYFDAAERFRATRFESELTQEERGLLWELTVRVDAAFNELGDLDRRRRAHRMRHQSMRRQEAQTVEIQGGAEAEYARAYEAMQQQRWADALEHFSRCVELDPSRGSYHYRVGQSLLKLGETDPDIDWERAKTSFERALEIDPENLEYLLGLGKLWKARGNASLAMPYFKRVRDLDPGHIEANREIQSYLASKRDRPETRSTTARLLRMLKRK